MRAEAAAAFGATVRRAANVVFAVGVAGSRRFCLDQEDKTGRGRLGWLTKAGFFARGKKNLPLIDVRRAKSIFAAAIGRTIAKTRADWIRGSIAKWMTRRHNDVRHHL